MASDPKARQQSLNYTGGSITTTVGVLEEMFGTNYAGLTAQAGTLNVAVKAHSRTRVIGGASTSVSSYNYSYKNWPTSEANNSAGGAVVLMRMANIDGTWTARITGSMAALGDFLNTEAVRATTFRTERGTNYGPFKKP